MEHTAEELKTLKTLRELIDRQYAEIRENNAKATPTMKASDLAKITKKDNTLTSILVGMFKAGNALGFTTAELMNIDYTKQA